MYVFMHVRVCVCVHLFIYSSKRALAGVNPSSVGGGLTRAQIWVRGYSIGLGFT